MEENVSSPSFSFKFLSWPRASVTSTAGVLLAFHAFRIVGGPTATTREPGPQGGQAVGCLKIVLVELLGIGALLAAGVYWRVTWLVWATFGVSVLPIVGVARGAMARIVRRR